ncbi:MAG: glycosyltransferase family 4 protein [Candidatus Thermoplasmatota archaeon]|nr:glycosyltransferase family 4 protein [Candidatus Thermoplasmatota archaeon]
MQINFVVYKLSSLHSGLAISLFEYSRVLVTMGHNVTVYALTADEDAVKKFKTIGVELLYVKKGEFLLYDYRMVAYSRSFQRMISTLIRRNYRPGKYIIYADEAVMLSYHKTPDPWMYICQGDWSMLAIHSGFKKRHLIASKFLGIMVARLITAKSRALKMYQNLAANSKFTAQLSSFLYDIPITSVVYPPIRDSSRFSNLKSVKEKRKEGYALVVLRNSEESGVDFISELGKRFQIKVIGGAQIANCENLGFVRDEDISDLFSHALVTLSAANNEYFGRQLAESLSYGTPVLAFETCGAVEIISNGYNGWLAKTKEDFVSILANIFKDGYEYDIVGNCKRSSERFSAELVVKQVLESFAFPDGEANRNDKRA